MNIEEDRLGRVVKIEVATEREWAIIQEALRQVEDRVTSCSPITGGSL